MTLTDEPTAAAQLMNSVAESRAFAGKYINSNARLIQEGEDADELLRLLNLDPDLYRTECGFINLPKVKAALKYPDDYPLLNPATPIPPTPSQQESVPKGFIVVSKDLLAEAIACNTDASLAEARHIINSVLKVSDDEIFREALKELEQ